MAAGASLLFDAAVLRVAAKIATKDFAADRRADSTVAEIVAARGAEFAH